MTIFTEEQKALFRGFREIGAFLDSRDREGGFLLKDGRTSPFYIDLRRAASSPQMRGLIASEFQRMMTGVEMDVIAGIPVAAMSFATTLSDRTGLNLVTPRVEKKAYGSTRRVEGVFEEDQVAGLFDDVLTTAKTKLDAVEVLQEAGLRVTDIFVLVMRGDPAQLDSRLRLHYTCTGEELLQFYYTDGSMPQGVYDECMTFLRAA